MANEAIKHLAEQGVLRLCACGCGKVIRSSHHRVKYFNKRHRNNVYNKSRKEERLKHPKKRNHRVYRSSEHLKKPESKERVLKNLRVLYDWACERNDWFYKSDVYDIKDFDRVWICGESDKKRSFRWIRLISGMIKVGLIERRRNPVDVNNNRRPHYQYRAILGMLE